MSEGVNGSTDMRFCWREFQVLFLQMIEEGSDALKMAGRGRVTHDRIIQVRTDWVEHRLCHTNEGVRDAGLSLICNQ